MAPAIVLEGLRKEYGARAVVRDINLTIEAGQVFGFLGPNGAGKTTTIAMLLHLVRPSSGRALLLGHDVWHEPEAALRSTGALIEAPAFFPYLSAENNLRVLARAERLPDTRVAAVLELVDLAPYARERFKNYSQGMRQRLALAAALLGDPQILILDEPLNGLDPAGTYEMRQLLRRLSDAGRTVFLSSHQLSEVQQTCRRVAVLKQGRIIAQDSVAALLRGEGGLLVRVESDAATALELLCTHPQVAAAEAQQDRLLIDAPAESAKDINRFLVANGVEVAELRPREMQLEEFFLRITEGGGT